MLRHALCAAVALVIFPSVLAAESTRPASATFNPAFSLILDGKFASLSADPETFAIAGFSLGNEAGELNEGLFIDETELAVSANVDDRFYGQVAAVLADGGVEVEEAFFETLSLGGGLTVKAGRFLSGIGYSNSTHPHAWDFADQALPFRAMIGRHHLADDGVQLRWVAPSDLFLEIGGEVLRGEGFPAGGAATSGKGTSTAFVRIGGDLGPSNAWRAGLARLSAKARERESGDEAVPDLFTGDVDLSIVDVVWKWSPNGNTQERYLKILAEYFRRDENGVYDLGSAGVPAAFDSRQNGWYAQAVYRFMPRWRAGLRYAQADAGRVNAAFAGTVLDADGHKPTATTFMVDFSNSEFSRLRLQFTRDESRVNETDNQIVLQYNMSLGAHGAHAF